MKYRKLGNSGLKVSVLALGGWLTYGGTTSDDVAELCMIAAYNAGINFFDTAETYGNGKCEITMGKIIKKQGWKRSDLVISTKLYFGGPGPNDKSLSRKHIIEGLDASLKRLQLEYVDLVYAHRPDPDTPLEEMIRAFNHVINQGKAFYWGTSEFSADQLEQTYKIAKDLSLIGPTMEQPEYNLFHRERVEKEYESIYKDYGLGLTIWSPLSSGILTGKYNNGSIEKGSRMDVVEFKRNWIKSQEARSKINLVKRLEPIANKLNISLAQLSIAWCLKNKNISSVILGASSPDQIHHNLKALEVVEKLTSSLMDEIDAIFKIEF